MNTPRERFPFVPKAALASLALALAAGSAFAQSPVPAPGESGSPSTSGGTGFGRAWSSADGFSILPFTRKGYVGINLGRSEFDTACSVGDDCGNPDLSGRLYTGGLVTEWLGAEVGYMNSGTASRSGGDTRVQGLDLMLVGRVPLGKLNVFAKAGAVYGEAKVSTGLLSTTTAGTRRGWGPAYGVGVGFDFTPASGVVLEWTRHEIPFPGLDRQSVDTTTLGYVHRF